MVDMEPGRRVVEDRPCVVPYLYVHTPDEVFEYPSARAGNDLTRLAWRYLECALVQVASLRLRSADCDIVFVTNVAQRRAAIGDHGTRLLDSILDYGAEIRYAEYDHRTWARSPSFYSSHYVFDAIDAVADEGRLCLLTDVDCVWIDPARVFVAAGKLDAIGSVQLIYPPDFDLSGLSPTSLGRLGGRLGGNAVAVKEWIGGELLTGTGSQLAELGRAASVLEAEAAAAGTPLTTEEHLLTLAHTLGRVYFGSLNDVGGRIWTGPRHGAVNPERPLELGLWHLPGEKGLAFRRAANDLLKRREAGLQRDLADPAAAGRRFNVTGLARRRRMADDAWIARERARSLLASRMRR